MILLPAYGIQALWEACKDDGDGGSRTHGPGIADLKKHGGFFAGRGRALVRMHLITPEW
jgi:hypothetical protein